MNCEAQDESLYDIWEREWTFYDMIKDYYEKHPDSGVMLHFNDEGRKQKAK